MGADGKATGAWTPPPIPGLNFKLQGATVDGTTIHTTNGLDLTHR